MARTMGAIRFSDGTIRYYEYNGTSDVVMSFHYETKEEVSENWRSNKWANCQCGKLENVDIYTAYGVGFYIGDGQACKACNSISVDGGENLCIIESSDIEDNWAEQLFYE